MLSPNSTGRLAGRRRRRPARAFQAVGAFFLALPLAALAACASSSTFAATAHPQNAPLREPRSKDPFASFDAIRLGDYRLSVNAVYESFVSGDFTLGSVKESWDGGHRGELDFFYHLEPKNHIEPILGGFLFWETRDWEEDAASLDYDVIGFGLEGAAVFHAVAKPQERFNVGLMPYVRFGLGFQDGEFRNVPSPGGFSTGDVSGQRGEGTLGLDLRATLFRNVTAALGGGFTYWYSPDADAVTRDQTGAVVDDDDSLKFKGNDAFVRFSVGLKF